MVAALWGEDLIVVFGRARFALELVPPFDLVRTRGVGKVDVFLPSLLLGSATGFVAWAFSGRWGSRRLSSFESTCNGGCGFSSCANDIAVVREDDNNASGVISDNNSEGE
ncbi:hypothetical protein LR48_Vigan01g043100 [Vigna angularis]|uniref:Uncharacterized protein n=1 Tax=Phaseolus angularis TaxID=3914 RepID=A0A0L9TK59_PHAAN|nr:hypothetical protein LR48_Vigan01g043100 [Vigna angularis]